jgi:glycoprotein-N-acetylgalactosamine 3-beta-galactosyltransferase
MILMRSKRNTLLLSVLIHVSLIIFWANPKRVSFPDEPLLSPGSRTVNICCWILASDSSSDLHKSNAIRNGWGQFCDASHVINTTTPGIRTDWREGYKHISEKSFRAWNFIHEKYSSRCDFFMKADTDTFVLGSNLRLYLQRFDPLLPHYMGKQFVKQPEGTPFVAGSAIILSKGALNLFSVAVQHQTGRCTMEAFSKRNSAEDLALGDCMNDLGVYPHNTRDDVGAERFMVFHPKVMSDATRPLPQWYIDSSFNKETGESCCSETAVVFHHISLDELIYSFLERKKGLWLWRNKTNNLLSL